jgi:hypothetical protein
MDPEQVAQLNQLRGMYGNGQGPQFSPQQTPQFARAQPQQFQGFAPPQHQPLAGPQLGGGGQGGGGGGGGGQQGGGGIMEGAQKLIQAFAQGGGKQPQAGQPVPQGVQPAQGGVVGPQRLYQPPIQSGIGTPPAPGTDPVPGSQPMAAPPGPPVPPIGPAPAPQMPLLKAGGETLGTPKLADFFQLRRSVGL